jgi:hypothetical protein
MAPDRIDAKLVRFKAGQNLHDHEPLTLRIHNTPTPNFGNFLKRTRFIQQRLLNRTHLGIRRATQIHSKCNRSA